MRFANVRRLHSICAKIALHSCEEWSVFFARMGVELQVTDLQMFNVGWKRLREKDVRGGKSLHFDIRLI